MVWGSGTATLTPEVLLWHLSRLPRLKKLVLDHVSFGEDMGNNTTATTQSQVQLLLPAPLHPALRPPRAFKPTDFKLELDLLCISHIDGFGWQSSHFARLLGGFTTIKALAVNSGLTAPNTKLRPQCMDREDSIRVETLSVDCVYILDLLSASVDLESVTEVSLRPMWCDQPFVTTRAFLHKLTNAKYAAFDIPWAWWVLDQGFSGAFS